MGWARDSTSVSLKPLVRSNHCWANPKPLAGGQTPSQALHRQARCLNSPLHMT